ncbi:MAG: fluoride efflux transporter CrcB [Alphaproteobacteria bacterium]|nr:MAG: fluoride efflux transporter CrcB [Alphaproteobacteria bacterium]
MNQWVLGAWVAAGSALGGLLRFTVSGLVARFVGETFPFGTLTVNVTGSFLIGLVAALSAPEGRWMIAPEIRLFLMLGIFGGFTTFSSFSLQTLSLVQDGEWVAAFLNIVGSVALCLIAVWIGWAAGWSLNR